VTAPRHWPVYLIEAACLGLFMVSACTVATALEHPLSPLHRAVPEAAVRRMLGGIAMGLTAVGLIYSPWGRRSGAHMNPSLTFTYLRLRKIAPGDAAAYVVAQLGGALAGVLVARAALGAAVADPAVDYAVTMPGPRGAAVAFLAELLISFGLMGAVLLVSNSRLARFTGVCAGLLVATYISIEAPLSGMSMNPARTLGSAFHAGRWTALWVYCTAPPLGMLAAAEAYVRLAGRAVFCAKLHHDDGQCIFRCRYPELAAERAERALAVAVPTGRTR
jgi:aquaporin Z